MARPSPSPDPVSIDVPDARGARRSHRIGRRGRAIAAFAPGAQRVGRGDVDAARRRSRGARHATRGRGGRPARSAPSVPSSVGLYRVRAEARQGSAIARRGRSLVLRRRGDREFADPRLNEGVLRRLAASSGGRYSTIDEVGGLAAAIRSSAPSERGARTARPLAPPLGMTAGSSRSVGGVDAATPLGAADELHPRICRDVSPDALVVAVLMAVTAPMRPPPTSRADRVRRRGRRRVPAEVRRAGAARSSATLGSASATRTTASSCSPRTRRRASAGPRAKTSARRSRGSAPNAQAGRCRAGAAHRPRHRVEGPEGDDGKFNLVGPDLTAAEWADLDRRRSGPPRLRQRRVGQLSVSGEDRRTGPHRADGHRHRGPAVRDRVPGVLRPGP